MNTAMTILLLIGLAPVVIGLLAAMKDG